ncbi:MAG TPA: hypothetical protein VL098_05280 [Flavipsychrobacter sp.]|nr:hypothetical protein [Flavipsychrobacter sp.]
MEDNLDTIDRAGSRKTAFEQKFKELISLSADAGLSPEDIRNYKERLDRALGEPLSYERNIERYKELDDKHLSRIDMLDELGKLLIANPVDNSAIRQHKKKDFLTSTLVSAIGFTLMALGLAMIILPAPASFEIYTLFYFTPDDGVTIMDVISLLIVFTGVFIIITAMKRNDK